MPKYIELVADQVGGYDIQNIVYNQHVGQLKLEKEHLVLTTDGPDVGYSNGCLKDLLKFLADKYKGVIPLKYLTFAPKKEWVEILNSWRDSVGLIKKARVGRFMHWCFFSYYSDIQYNYFCIKEISEYITTLYKRK